MNEAAPMPPSPSLESVIQAGWLAWTEAARLPGHPFRTPVVATAGDDGDARVVVLRAVDPAAGELEFHTDARSPKVAALRRSAWMTWVFYDPVSGVQWRVRGTGRLHVGDPVWKAAWDRVPQGSRASYGLSVAPGSAVASPQEAIPFAELGPDNFAVVRCRVDRVDWLWLRPQGNLRASWRREATAWKGSWVAP